MALYVRKASIHTNTHTHAHEEILEKLKRMDISAADINSN